MPQFLKTLARINCRHAWARSRKQEGAETCVHCGARRKLRPLTAPAIERNDSAASGPEA